MRLGIDLQLESLQGDQFNKLDAPAKDFIINSMITGFVQETIDGANYPNVQKRLPGGVVAFKDILQKYNNIRTLIKVTDIIPGILTPAEFTEIDLSTLNPALYHYETSFSTITIGGKNYQLPNVHPEVYDLAAFNIDPYGGKKKLMGTILYGNTLRTYGLSRYTFVKITVIYIRRPAVVMTGVDCDLPENIHDEIINRTARFISGVQTNSNYQYLSSENKPTES